MDDLSARSAAKPTLRLSAHRREYERRVNRVMDYVQAHLVEDLTLEKLAAVAAFSPFHFHRVFAAITGETLSDFIRRIRLERAASALGLLHDTSVLEIALRYGFSSAATFARAFKAHFGMSATEWRDGGSRDWIEARRGGASRAKRFAIEVKRSAICVKHVRCRSGMLRMLAQERLPKGSTCRSRSGRSRPTGSPICVTSGPMERISARSGLRSIAG
jgi:AraC-like DNA-binding protein